MIASLTPSPGLLHPFPENRNFQVCPSEGQGQGRPQTEGPRALPSSARDSATPQVPGWGAPGTLRSPLGQWPPETPMSPMALCPSPMAGDFRAISGVPSVTAEEPSQLFSSFFSKQQDSTRSLRRGPEAMVWRWGRAPLGWGGSPAASHPHTQEIAPQKSPRDSAGATPRPGIQPGTGSPISRPQLPPQLAVVHRS